MKSAYLIAASSGDLEQVAALWRAKPSAQMGEDVIQWVDSGYLFNVFTDADDVQEQDWREGWRESERSDGPPEAGVAWYIECRSEEVVARVLGEASAVAPGRLWVLDSNDVVWPADAIDPKRIVL